MIGTLNKKTEACERVDAPPVYTYVTARIFTRVTRRRVRGEAHGSLRDREKQQIASSDYDFD